MGWWNTGCLVVHNYTNNAYTIVDQETIHSEPLIPGLRLVVGPRANNSFDGTIFPWCTDSTDVLVKAFRFYRGAEVIGDLEFFMFQDENDLIAWTPQIAGSFANASYDERQSAGALRSSLVDIAIRGDGTPLAIRVKA